MEDLRTAIKLVFPRYLMATIDLEDAYYLVPVSNESRKYLRFEFSGILYQINCLPFGLCSSPFVYTKIMKPVIKTLRKRGFSSVIYLDDILCIENSLEKCQHNVSETINLLETLGFLINWKKVHCPQIRPANS